MNEYMNIALKEAKKAYKKKEIPVGSIIIRNNKIIAKSHNDRQRTNNVLGHAEINAIIKASKKIHDWRLDGCVMYVTLEPCEMCKIIIQESRIDKVYYLIKQKNNKLNANNNLFTQTNVCDEQSENYQKILTDFFKKLR